MRSFQILNKIFYFYRFNPSSTGEIKKPHVQILSSCISLETLSSTLLKKCCSEGNAYSYRFEDIAKGRSKLAPTSGVQRVKEFHFQWKTKRNVRPFLKLLEKWLNYKFRRFRMLFFVCLTLLLSTGKIGKLDFWDCDHSTNFKHQ